MDAHFRAGSAFASGSPSSVSSMPDSWLIEASIHPESDAIALVARVPSFFHSLIPTVDSG